MKIVTSQLCAELSAQAAQLPRLRTNFNLHAGPEDAVQRFLNAVEPGSYVRPHRHCGRWEMMIALSGTFSLLTFADDCRVQQRVEFGKGGAQAVEAPPDILHSLVVTAPGTLILEVKPGPYSPASDKDFAAWAPAEGSPEVAAFLAWLTAARPGDRLPVARLKG